MNRVVVDRVAGRVTDFDRMLCASTAHLLHATATSLGRVGLGCALLAAAALLFKSSWPVAALAVLLLLPVERVLALRLHLDAGLFDALAREPYACLTTLDASLQSLALRDTSALPRPLPDRVAGARRLALSHALVVALQGLAVGTFVGATALGAAR